MFMRVRLWARQAPRSQVAVTAIVGAIAIALLAVIAVPKRATSTRSVLAGVGEGAPGSLSEPSTPTAGANPVASPTDAVGRVAPGTAPAATGPATAMGGAEPVAPGTELRRASDQGITARTIKVGFAIAKIAGLDATGQGLGIRQDQQAAIKAIVDSQNKAGGVNGRQIIYTTVNQDPTNQAGWQPACVTLTEDQKVFAVLDPGAYVGAGHLCYLQHRVPQVTIAANTLTDTTIKQAGGYIVSSGESGTRAVLNWAAIELADGAIGGKEKLGLLDDECFPEIFDHAVKPYLERHGVAFAEARLSCDVGTAQQQAPGAVLQLRQAGVTTVFLGTIFTSAQTFMSAAAGQAWKPKYTTSDLWGNNGDLESKNFPPDQFDRAISVTSTASGEMSAGHPFRPPVQRCSKILTDAGLPGISNPYGKDAEVTEECDTFFLFVAAMRRTPVNPTRADWVAAVPSLGAYEALHYIFAIFRPGKWEGGDSYAKLEWRRQCTCWVQIRKHQPASL